MDFKEQQAQPPPLPDTPPPDEDEQDNMHSRIDTHSIETPSNDQKSTTVSESGSAASPMHSRSFSPASAVSSGPSHIKDSLDAADDHGNISRVNSTGSNWGGLNLNMTAKEMREMIGSKKKRDPRRDDSRLDFHKKYEIIQTL